MGNIEDGSDIERFGQDFANDIKKGEALREKLRKESKENIAQYNKEKTESMEQEQIQEAKDKIEALDTINEGDFIKDGKIIGSKFSDDNKFVVYEKEYDNGHRMLVLSWKKNGKVEARMISSGAFDKMRKMYKEDAELQKELSLGIDYDFSMTNAVIPRSVRFEYEKPVLEGEVVIVDFKVLTVRGKELFSEKSSENVQYI